MEGKKVEDTTLQNILNSGKDEFLEKGFRAASLRNIVKKAGVTTGAFYGYYKSKEMLFHALVEEPARIFLTRFEEVQNSFFTLSEEEQVHNMGSHSNVFLDWMIEYIYNNFDAFKLIFCCAEGTEYEDFIHRMVEIEEKSNHQFISVLQGLGYTVKEIEPQLEHIIISSMLYGFCEIVIHDMQKYQAQKFIKGLQEFYTAGWVKIMGL